ncbi:MAG: permease, partial [Candidatus Aminicenantes bacterium]|nr:permease [Candidatus Aminicenantes bacterium]
DPKAAFGLTILGVVGVLIAAYIVKSLPLTILKWVVVVVILYTSVMMFQSVRKKKGAATPAEACQS